ncbi:secretion system protein F [Micrococcus sp.]|uniref:secretion system protein F n=1 Tax=Micrococcus sp. TaxID=1271 RepID=UPI002A90B622|nr:secretion system protein F [Micrococcus sp.]MDY6055297.1 secretion system protein F [Micrococcus sp.]
MIALPLRHRDPEAATEHVVEALRRWAALLRAGLTPQAAWTQALQGLPEDVADHTAPAWQTVRAALAAAGRAGAAPAEVARRLADALEASVDAARARRSAAAGPRATARLLSWLPLLGLGLAWLLGMGPADLLATPAGWVVLLLGGVFSAAGWAWARLAVRRATREPGEVDPAVVVDLLAALLGAGRSLPVALDDVAVSLPGAADLRVVTTLLLWGVDWDEAWEPVADRPAWAAVGERLRPLHGTGMAGTGTLTDAAAALRQQGRREDERAAEELAVRLVVPLGLCQLPAFVCWGVVPMAMALLR